MYIQHVCEAAERYMQHMYTNENYLQITPSNTHVRINYSHGKNSYQLIRCRYTKSKYKEYVKKKTEDKKTKPKKPNNNCIKQKKEEENLFTKIHESFVDQ